MAYISMKVAKNFHYPFTLAICLNRIIAVANPFVKAAETAVNKAVPKGMHAEGIVTPSEDKVTDGEASVKASEPSVNHSEPSVAFPEVILTGLKGRDRWLNS